MKKILSIFIISLIALTNIFAIAVSDDSVSGVERYALYIGANYGGRSRERLLYAQSDALSFKKTMSEIGGVTDSNSRILYDPTKEGLDKALQEITETIKNSSSNSKRSEFIFYYSGHSDENSLLLGDTKYDYSTLKEAISDVPSDIHVVILDSCYSGNFIRTKGGQKRKPFLVDDSTVVTGHAYLSSSSDNESSQESDEIESSFFTNAMITGLRGAADTSGDNKVTLNELYSYAFNDTLSKTEASKAGPQHPNYNITLVGSGDLVLSDLTIGEAMLSLSKDAKGKFIIRDANDKLVSEINKAPGQPIFMALPKGQYSAVIIDDYSTKQGTFLLQQDQVYVLDQNTLTTIKRKSNRLRGDKKVDNDDNITETEQTRPEHKKRQATARTDNNETLSEDEDLDEDFDLDFSDDDEDLLPIDDLNDDPKTKQLFKQSIYNVEEYYSFDDSDFSVFNLSFVPGFSFINNKCDNLIFSFGIIGSKVHNIKGVQFSEIMNISTGNIHGAQIAGLFNIGTNDISGVQLSGLFNIARHVSGGQISGLFNMASSTDGIQIGGIFNIAKQNSGSQVAGLMNISKEIEGSQVSGLLNVANKIHGSQIGVFNMAKSISGLQLGLFNIAQENTGVTLGLFNYVVNGLHDVYFAWDTNDIIDICYKGGSYHLFTTIGIQHDRDSFFNDYEYSARNIYFGLGTEFNFGSSNLQLEYNTKLFAFSNASPIIQNELKQCTFAEKISQSLIPSFKITYNAFATRYFSFFISTSFDIFNDEYNHLAYNAFEPTWTWDIDEIKVCPSVSIGVSLPLDEVAALWAILAN